MTSAILVLSNTLSKPAFSISRIATGPVMSLASVKSTFASISCPAATLSIPACFARIFCVIVMPITDVSSCPQSMKYLLIPLIYALMEASITSVETPRPVTISPPSMLTLAIASACASSPSVIERSE